MRHFMLIIRNLFPKKQETFKEQRESILKGYTLLRLTEGHKNEKTQGPLLWFGASSYGIREKELVY